VAEAESRERSRAQPAALLGAVKRLPGTPLRSIGRGIALPEGKPDGNALLRDTLHRRLLGATDAIAAAVALVAGFSILDDQPLEPMLFVSLPLVVLAAKAIGLYDRDQHLIRKTTLDEAPAIFQLATLFALGTWLAMGPFADTEPTRASILVMWMVMLASMLVGRATARRLALRVAPAERCLVLGSHAAAERLRHKLHFSHHAGAEVVGRVPLDDAEPPGKDMDVLGSKEMLGLALAEHDVERVIIAPSGADSDGILDAIRLVKALGVKVSVVPRLLEVVGSTAEFDEIDGITLLGVRRYGLTRSSEAMKRTLDLCGAAFGLVLLAPLLAWISIAVSFGSSGPVLFRQRRIGRKGEEFWMLKFRTMRDGAEEEKDGLLEHNESEGGLFKIADDPRVTRVGRVLRRTSLDELPQLINVLRGDMSLVGPRPLVPDEDAQIEGWQRGRLLVRPGMTGLWQIFGSARIPMHEMVKIDYLYGANWSLWGDVKILLRTVPYMFARRGM
jgi:exopolysaccharide biosynthesis polyprenyl glycosylphosphotransferase